MNQHTTLDPIWDMVGRPLPFPLPHTPQHDRRGRSS